MVRGPTFATAHLDGRPRPSGIDAWQQSLGSAPCPWTARIPRSSSTFYRELLDLEVMFETEDFVALKGAAVLLTVQRVDRPSTAGLAGHAACPKQVHLELAVSDLDAAEAGALGARSHEA